METMDGLGQRMTETVDLDQVERDYRLSSAEGLAAERTAVPDNDASSFDQLSRRSRAKR